MIQWRIFMVWGIVLVGVVGAHAVAKGEDGHRFYYEGDGQISITGQKSGFSFVGIYRQPSGQYDETAYKAICQVFGAPYHPFKTGLSLRLIAFLDYLEDHFSPGSRITITSGYRDPVYNTKIRQSGGLAAKASLHQYGMAADMKMTGVRSERIWDYVKKIGFGGAGYYHGETVHLDVGPARSWDETSSGVGTGLSDNNKLIGLVTDLDRYRSGERVALRFIRMTAFPIGVVPEFALTRVDRSAGSREVVRFTPSWAHAGRGRCSPMNDISQMASIQWRLPAHLPPGPYTISAWFCEPPWERMPAQVVTPVFEVNDHTDSTWFETIPKPGLLQPVE